MNVGVLVQFKEKNLTGIPKVAAGIMENISAIDASVDYYYLGEEPFLPRQYKEIPVVYNNGAMFDLDFMLSRYSLNIVHSYYYAYNFSNKKTKRVLTIHDLMHYTHPEWFYKSTNEYFRNELKECAKKSDKIIADSEYTKADIINCYGIDSNKIETIYDAIYPAKFFEKEGKKPSFKNVEKDNFILSVSAVHVYKNQVGLIEAYVAFRERNLDSNLKLVITGPLRKDMKLNEVCKDENIRKNIIFTGYVSDEELVWLYKNCYFFMFVSFFEGFGLPILEAMSCRKAVVCSNTTSMPEVGGDAVVYCNPYDKESIIDAMELVVNDEQQKANYEKKAYIRSKIFSYEKAAEQTVELYKSIL